MTTVTKPHPAGFHGPRSWIVSALVGAALGFIFALVFPASIPEHGADNGHGRALPRVKEIPPTGEPVEVLPDGTTRPWPNTASPPHTDAHEPRPTHSAPAQDPAHHAPSIPLLLCLPFALLLLSIAVMPFINARFWHRHYPDFAFLLGAFTLAYYLAAFGPYGRHEILHVAREYYAFIALVGGLYIVSGGILIDVRRAGTPLANTALLAFGAALANVVGTTGASVLLIRPFMRMNRGRLRPLHIVLFIFIVSNCGGCLTPIGDPPLYLGYLKGVPFLWTLHHLWPMWLFCVGVLLAIFFVIDARIGPAAPGEGPQEGIRDDYDPDGRPRPLIGVSGAPALICLALMVAGVFIDPLVAKLGGPAHLPIGPTFQIAVAVAAYRLADPAIHGRNAFTFEPVKEVGFLFAGIFLTMAPALGYLAANGSRLGLETPTQYYFGTGALSAVLDNAPTYLNFLQTAFGVLHLPLDASGIARFIENTYDVVHADGTMVEFQGHTLLEAISLAAVFFGAMTYIGNGPNFMVKAIAEERGLKMPSFFAYLLYACLILLPILILVWVVFIR